MYCYCYGCGWLRNHNATLKNTLNYSEAIASILWTLSYNSTYAKEMIRALGSCQLEKFADKVLEKLYQALPHIESSTGLAREILILPAHGEIKVGYRKLGRYYVKAHFLNALNKKSLWLFRNEYRNSRAIKRGGKKVEIKQKNGEEGGEKETGPKFEMKGPSFCSIDDDDMELNLAAPSPWDALDLQEIVDIRIGSNPVMERFFNYRLDEVKEKEIMEKETCTSYRCQLIKKELNLVCQHILSDFY